MSVEASLGVSDEAARDCLSETSTMQHGMHLVNTPQMWVFCRIDYHLATPGVAALARKEHIHLEPRFSDHAPLTIDYDFTL